MSEGLTFDLENRGLGILNWHIEPVDSDDCFDELNQAIPCVYFDPMDGELSAGAVESVTITVLAPPFPVIYSTRAVSDEGYIEITLVPQPPGSMADYSPGIIID